MKMATLKPFFLRCCKVFRHLFVREKSVRCFCGIFQFRSLSPVSASSIAIITSDHKTGRAYDKVTIFSLLRAVHMVRCSRYHHKLSYKFLIFLEFQRSIIQCEGSRNRNLPDLLCFCRLHTYLS